MIWPLLLATGITAPCLYLLLPALASRHNPYLADASLKEQKANWDVDKIMPLQRRYAFGQKKKQDLLHKAGHSSTKAFKYYLILQLGLPCLIFLLTLAAGGGFLTAGSGAALLAVLFDHLLAKKASRNKERFSRSLYKIYRFLDGQITAGISVPDALRGLPEAVRDPLVQKGLDRFVALFEMTLDLEHAMDGLDKIFDSGDCNLLAAHLRQCLASGIAGKGLVRTEELLFSRAFAQMQAQTSGIRSRLTLIAAAALLVLLIIFIYPLLHSAFFAVQTIFG